VGPFAPAEIGIDPVVIDSALLKGLLILNIKHNNVE